MIEYNLDTTTSVLYIKPTSSLEKSDFIKLAEVADPHIEATGGLAGVIIDAPAFPGWDSLGAMVEHFRFVRDHHQHVQKVCIVTDSAIGDVAERLASHFITAEIKHFPAGSLDAAKQWVSGTA